MGQIFSTNTHTDFCLGVVLTMQPIQATLPLFDTPRPSLDNFVAGPNAAALAALRAVADGHGVEFIHLWGPEGCGRTHLLRALDPLASNGVPLAQPGRRVYAVDNVERLDALGQAQLFEIQRAVREGRAAGLALTLITAGNAAPAHLPFREDVRTRLAWGLVFCLHHLPETELKQALQARALALGTQLDADLLDYMLTRLPRDLRSLIGLVDELDRFALSRHRALTIPLLREWLQAHRPGGSEAA
jgi:DnaA family protein